MAKMNELMEKMRDEAFAKKFEGCKSVEDFVEVAKKEGYDITAEDMIAAEEECKAEIAAKTDSIGKELSASELENAAGGGLFMNETAPDGHEYDCVTSYHDFGYQTSRQEYCKDKYFCPSTSQTKYCFKDYH